MNKVNLLQLIEIIIITLPPPLPLHYTDDDHGDVYRVKTLWHDENNNCTSKVQYKSDNYTSFSYDNNALQRERGKT